jgi:hypothetical protein
MQLIPAGVLTAPLELKRYQLKHQLLPIVLFCRLHVQATRQCCVVLPHIIAILKGHLILPSSQFFRSWCWPYQRRVLPPQ